jgi:hypothetical protein
MSDGKLLAGKTVQVMILKQGPYASQPYHRQTTLRF